MLAMGNEMNRGRAGMMMRPDVASMAQNIQQSVLSTVGSIASQASQIPDDSFTTGSGAPWAGMGMAKFRELQGNPLAMNNMAQANGMFFPTDEIAGPMMSPLASDAAMSMNAASSWQGGPGGMNQWRAQNNFDRNPWSGGVGGGMPNWMASNGMSLPGQGLDNSMAAQMPANSMMGAQPAWAGMGMNQWRAQNNFDSNPWSGGAGGGIQDWLQRQGFNYPSVI